MDSAKLLSIALSLGIGSFAVALRYRVTLSWSHPAVIFAIFWFAMTGLPLVFVWGMPIEPLAVAYLAAITLAFGLPSLMTDWRSLVPVALARKSEPAPAGTLVALFYVMQLFVVFSIVDNLSRNGFSLGSYFLDPLAASTAYLNAASEGKIALSLVSTIGFALLYTAVAIGGFVVARQRSKASQAVLFVSAFIPSIMHIGLYSVKGTIFLAGALFFGGVIAARVQRGDLSLINKVTLKVGFGLLIPIGVLLVFAMLARPGRGMWGQDEQAAKVLYYLSSYAFGHLYAFSDWFSSYFLEAGALTYANPNKVTFGYWTFMSIGKVVNPEYVVPPGYFAEYFGPDKILQTNIYTAFRGMIYDFTLFGSLIFMAVFGAVANFAYQRMLKLSSPFISQAIFIFTVGWIYQSYGFSMFAWSTTIAAAVFTAIALFSYNGYHLMMSRPLKGNRSR